MVLINAIKEPYPIFDVFDDVINTFFNAPVKKQVVAISHIGQNESNIFKKGIKNTDIQLIFKPYSKICNILPRFKGSPTLEGCIYGLNCLDCRVKPCSNLTSGWVSTNMCWGEGMPNIWQLQNIGVILATRISILTNQLFLEKRAIPGSEKSSKPST